MSLADNQFVLNIAINSQGWRCSLPWCGICSYIQMLA